MANSDSSDTVSPSRHRDNNSYILYEPMPIILVSVSAVVLFMSIPGAGADNHGSASASTIFFIESRLLRIQNGRRTVD